MDLESLQRRFAIPGTLTFEQVNGLTLLKVTTPLAHAAMYLQGAHLTDWQPVGQEGVIFMSRKSELAPGVPIRGGVPIAFPWFATDSNKQRIDGHPGPSHGFARVQEWTLESAGFAGKDFVLKLTLGPTAMSRSMGYDRFLLTLKVAVGARLSMELTVANVGQEALSFEEAFHTYFKVVDVHEVKLTGLEPTPYVDKTDGMKVKPATGAAVTFTGATDRVYLDTEAACTIHDGTQRRDIRLVKKNSHTTVVFNPWKAMPDLAEWDWHEMLCVETVNAARNARTLAPGEEFTMGSLISVERWTG